MAFTHKLQGRPWPRHCQIFEVGPRDGLQAEAKVFQISERVELIRLLIDAGLENIEIGSFVRSDRIPQLKDSDEVLAKVRGFPKAFLRNTKFWAFIPNETGLDHALMAGVNGASFFVAISDTFCRKNINLGREEILFSLPTLLKKARKNSLKTRVYLSTLVYCPFEGVVNPPRVHEMVDRLFDMGVHEIVLSDTTGDANPRSLRRIFEKILKDVPPKNFALHLHDTRGLALANVLEGMYHGITKFDSSIAGMGGCPYAPGAAGNLATEDLANMLLGMELMNTVNLSSLAKAGFFAESVLGRKLPSSILRTLEKTDDESRAYRIRG